MDRQEPTISPPWAQALPGILLSFSPPLSPSPPCRGCSPKAPSRFWKMRQRWSRVILIRSCRKEGTRLQQGQALAEDRAPSHPLWAACPPTSATSSPHICFAVTSGQLGALGRPASGQVPGIYWPSGSIYREPGALRTGRKQGNSWFHYNHHQHNNNNACLALYCVSITLI